MTELDPANLFFETPWVWYVHFQCASINYGTSYMQIGSFSTIKEFWCLYNSVPEAGFIHDGSVTIGGYTIVAYSVFREGIRPEWEDPQNITGSEWGCRETLNRDQFDNLWKNYILGAIGEQIPHCVGIRAINKSNRTRVLHKIEVWMDCVEYASTQLCRRSLTSLVASTPRFSHMLHQEKKYQALEYQKRRRRNQLHALRSLTVENE